MIEIRWHGRGGQGAFTASKILGAAAVAEGKYALSFPSFGPERRGAPIQAFTKIGEEKIVDRTVIKKCDYIVFLDETLFNQNCTKDLKEGGKILINTKKPANYKGEYFVTLDADGLSEAILKRAVSNTAMLAALSTVSQIVSLDEIKNALHLYLPEKIANKNKEVVEAASNLLRDGKGD